MAIRACRPESGNLIRNREKMLQVKETLDEGYCDISGRVGSLIVIGGLFFLDCGHLIWLMSGEMGNVKVYLSEGKNVMLLDSHFPWLSLPRTCCVTSTTLYATKKRVSCKIHSPHDILGASLSASAHKFAHILWSRRWTDRLQSERQRFSESTLLRILA